MHKQNILQCEANGVREDREIRLYYVLTIILGIILFAVALKFHAPTAGSGCKDFLQVFCDAFFVSGLLLLSLWLIAWGWYHGVLDIFLYSASLVLSAFQKEQDMRNKETRDYVTYREHKKLERRAPTHLLVVGSAFLAASLLLYIVLSLQQ